MTSYNGFTPAERNAAQAWLHSQWAAGRPKPSRCCVCGQAVGVLDAHSEDYSEPYGDHLDKYPLCFACHMILHCRFRSPAAFARYQAMLKDGKRSHPYIRRDFERFKREWLEPCGKGPWIETDARAVGTVTLVAILADGKAVKERMVIANRGKS